MTIVNANVSSGLRPVRMAGSGYYTGGVNLYRVPAANAVDIGEGDPVYITGDADNRGYADVALVAAGAAAITGVVVGFRPLCTPCQPRFIEKGKEFYVLVADDPGIECLIQANDVVTPDMIGQNVDFAPGPVNPIYGLSGYQADIATIGVTPTLPMQIIGIFDAPDNHMFDETGTAITNVLLKVRLNNSARVDLEDGV